MNVLGFRFAAVEAGIKKRGGLDVALLVADGPVATAAVLTRNLVRAAPVHVTERRVRKGNCRAILVNAGNANACTGEPGMAACLASTAAIAAALGCPEDEVLVASTGVIGQILPHEKIVSRVPELVRALSSERALDFADAILTTDRYRKVSATKREVGGKTAEFFGMCKGAGMIHPDVGGVGKLPEPPGPPHATMLSFLVTDARVSSATLQEALERASEVTWNAVSVDGDTSTNDTVIAMASGLSRVELDVDELTEALVELCRPLARSMVRDGEGAEHAVDITVEGLPTNEDARVVAKTIATSPLVKTALAGKDANWGRLLASAGRAGIPFDPSQASVLIDGITICRNGLPGDAEADAAASARMKKEEFEIRVVLGNGPGRFTYTTCDFGHAYVDVNAGYRS